MKKPFWKSSNFWHSLILLAGQIWLGTEAAQILDGAQLVIDSVFAPNVQLATIIGAAFTFVNMIWQLFIKPKGTKTSIETDMERAMERVLARNDLARNAVKG